MRASAKIAGPLEGTAETPEMQLRICLVQANSAQNYHLVAVAYGENAIASAPHAIQNAVPVFVASRNAAMSS